MITILAGLALLATGASLWTLGEYLMHRFAMHELRGKGLASREHLRHHAERDSLLDQGHGVIDAIARRHPLARPVPLGGPS